MAFRNKSAVSRPLSRTIKPFSPDRIVPGGIDPVSNIAIAILKERDYQLWYTSATPPEYASVYSSTLLKIKGNYMIVFGTGWGLDHKNMPKLNGWLSPIEGVGKVRHLSVRAALVIYLDRLSKD